MRKPFALGMLGLSLLAGPVLMGCDDKKAETKMEVTRPDGTKKTDSVTVKESSDGTKKQVTEEHKDTAK